MRGTLHRSAAPLARLDRRARRGSTILLVVTILSLLVLLAITMTFASRMELSASHNYAVGVQNRVASMTAVDAIATRLHQSLPPGPMSPLDLTLSRDLTALRPLAGADSGIRASNSLQGLPPNESLRRIWSMDSNAASDARRDFRLVQTTGTGEVLVLDASARININAADVELLAGFFEVMAREHHWPIDPRALAEAIASVRLGPDGAPGRRGVDDNLNSHLALLADQTATPGTTTVSEPAALEALLAGVREDPALIPANELTARRQARRALLTNIDEPAEYVADIRLPAFGDDVRFSSVADLLRHPEIVRAGINPQIVAAITPHVTTFSISVDERLRGGTTIPLLDPNRADAEQVYEALRALYPDGTKSNRMLMQFAVNLVDARDSDSIPTLFPGTQGPDVVLGVERTPFITEVYPDSATPNEEGDDGQFVELHNPWSHDLDVTGWQLRTPDHIFPLEGKIVAGGFLVLTDDIDNSAEHPDRHLAGTGSLYDVFRVLPDNNRRRALADPAFSLPTTGRNIVVALHDRAGNLIDQFTYTPDPRDENSLYSYQRENPIVRETFRRRATPFALPPRSEEPEAWTLARLQNYPADGPFVTPLDVLGVFAGFSDPRTRLSSQWAFPVVATPKSAATRAREAAERPDRLDARVIDIFAIGDRPSPTEAGKVREKLYTLGRKDAQSSAFLKATALKSGADTAALAAVLAFEHPPGWHHGRLNVNTAGELALASLPGLDRERARRVVERRQRLLQRALQGDAEDAITYHSPSDLLVDDVLWPSEWNASQRIEAMRRLMPHISLNSRAFLLVGQPRLEASSDSDVQRAMRIEALVSLDRGAPEVLYWRNAASPEGGK